ncbi:MAG: hypothetical protein NC133_03650 [Prevotella sp.]|nr:hypothetical protein [Prevotella sp.]
MVFGLYQGGVALIFANRPVAAAEPTYKKYYVTNVGGTPTTNSSSSGHTALLGKGVYHCGWTLDGENLVDPDTMTLTADTVFYAMYAPSAWECAGFNYNYGNGHTWTNGTDIYYSFGNAQYRLNGKTWEPMTWTGLTSFYGNSIWTDGTNIYYSNESSQYRLNGTMWEPMTWTGLTSFYGYHVWTDGTDIYYSNNNSNQGQYRLNGTTWESTVGWANNIRGINTWSDGTNIYYSDGSTQLRLNGTTWERMTWSGLISSWSGATSFEGCYVWTDGTNIYYSNGSKQYRLNGTTWEAYPIITRDGANGTYVNRVWTDNGRFFTNVSCRPYRGEANTLGNIYYENQVYMPSAADEKVYYSVSSDQITTNYNGNEQRLEQQATPPAWYTDDMTLTYHSMYNLGYIGYDATPLTTVQDAGRYLVAATQTDGDTRYVQLHSYEIERMPVSGQINYTNWLDGQTPTLPTVEFLTADGTSLTLPYTLFAIGIDWAGMRQAVADQGLTVFDDNVFSALAEQFIVEMAINDPTTTWTAGATYYVIGCELNDTDDDNYDLTIVNAYDESQYPNVADYDITTMQGAIDYYEAMYKIYPHFMVMDASQNFATDVNADYNGAERTLAELHPAWLDDSITIVEAPIMRDVGAYQVTLEKDGLTQTIIVNILPKMVAVNIVGNGWVFGEGEQLPTGVLSGLITDDDVGYTIKYYNADGEEVVDFPAGTYTAKIVLSGASAANYALTGTVEKTFQVKMLETAAPTEPNSPTHEETPLQQWLGWAVVGGLVIIGGGAVAFLFIKLRKPKLRSANA